MPAADVVACLDGRDPNQVRGRQVQARFGAIQLGIRGLGTAVRQSLELNVKTNELLCRLHLGGPPCRSAPHLGFS